MLSRPLSIAALAALAMLAAPSPAVAGSPCCCAMPCAVPAPVVVYRVPAPPIYIVNQGPIYSGPYVYSQPQIVFPGPLANYPDFAESYPGYDAVTPPPRRVHRRALRARY
jgi:hypothetical protein